MRVALRELTPTWPFPDGLETQPAVEGEELWADDDTQPEVQLVRVRVR
jgi:hypothetical protein